eukprot:g1920.t1
MTEEAGSRTIPGLPCAYTNYFEVMAEAERADNEKDKIATMRLGATYNVFDGEELLEASVKAIRDQVDYVCVVYQVVSNFGHPCSDRLVSTLKHLVSNGLVDEIRRYDPKSFDRDERVQLVSVRAVGSETNSIDAIGDQFFNELSKREIGRQMCKARGCTHFMALDADEFYVSEELARAKSVILEKKVEGALCLMQYYFKDATIRLMPQDDTNYVSCIFKIASWMPFRLSAPYPFVVDPTRRLENLRRLHVFRRDELQMHHFSFVRRDISRKLQNVSNRASYASKREIEDFVRNFSKWDVGDPIIHPHPVFRKHFKTSVRVQDTFAIGKVCGN